MLYTEITEVLVYEIGLVLSTLLNSKEQGCQIFGKGSYFYYYFYNIDMQWTFGSGKDDNLHDLELGTDS